MGDELGTEAIVGPDGPFPGLPIRVGSSVPGALCRLRWSPLPSVLASCC